RKTARCTSCTALSVICFVGQTRPPAPNGATIRAGPGLLRSSRLGSSTQADNKAQSNRKFARTKERAGDKEDTAMKHVGLVSALALAGLFTSSVVLAGPKIVSGPGANPECFKPWDAKTKYFQWPKKQGPYKIALVNGFVGNTWRIQMVKTAKAFAD